MLAAVYSHPKEGRFMEVKRIPSGFNAYRWVVLALFIFVALISQLLWLTFAPISSEMTDHFAVTAFDISLLSLVWPLIFVIIALPVGIFIDRYGFKKSVGVGSLFLAVFATLRIFSASPDNNFTILLITQTGAAISQPFIFGSITKLSTSWFPEKEQGLATGLGTIGLFLGMMLALAITPFLYQSYGFPIEMINELADEKSIKVDEKGFYKEFEKHQKLSRTAAEGKFKSGLADSSEQTTKLHTAAHLLNEALRTILKKPDLSQKGSNINPERLRFDFNFDRKLTDKEKEKIEELVNKKIQENLKVVCEEMSVKQAKDLGAHGAFESKYGSKIKVYSIGKFSKEICAGPHVQNTGELGKFKITKEQSSSAGVRRIKAILEK